MSDGIYSMGPGKSPGTFSYPAFTFPGPQVIIPTAICYLNYSSLKKVVYFKNLLNF